MAKPEMRCPVCRMWRPVTAATKVLPQHNNPVIGGHCSGSGRPPAAKRGRFDK